MEAYAYGYMRQAAELFFTVNFIPIAQQYLAFLDGLGEVQADSYSTLGQGVFVAVELLADTAPVAATARWYVDSSNAIDARLTPQ